jgi:hypothetical protein
MLETATVTTRPPACGVADILPAEPISDMIQSPKKVSFGIAVRRHCQRARRKFAFSAGSNCAAFPHNGSLDLPRLRFATKQSF